MKKEQIITQEKSNNLNTIHAYYNEMSYTWIAYGYSAYSLRLIVKANNQNCFRGFSMEYDLPYVVVDDKIFKNLLSRNDDVFSIFEKEVIP